MTRLLPEITLFHGTLGWAAFALAYFGTGAVLWWTARMLAWLAGHVRAWLARRMPALRRRLWSARLALATRWRLP